MSMILDGSNGLTTPGVVNTAGETIATTLSVTGAASVGSAALASTAKLSCVIADGGPFQLGLAGTTKAARFYSSATGFVIEGTDQTLTGSYQPMVLGGSTVSLAINSTAQLVVTAAGLLQFNSGYGSAATAYGCRAWVNFNGQSTVSIRASGNVSSITDNGTGDYTVNFTTALVDANYSPVCMTENGDSNGNRGAGGAQINYASAPTTSALRIFTAYGATASTDGAKNDQSIICVAIFR